jgi:purine catabolism regulator
MTIGGFASADLIGGSAGLDRHVRWVRILETPATVEHLQPGDLLLTTGYPIKDDRAAQLRLISEICDAGGAGLVVKPERYLTSFPADMAGEADRLAIPLFTLPEAVPWNDLMNPLLERIINAEHARLKQSIDIHHQFTDLVLDGKGVTEICRTLADLLGTSVVVEDASFHLLAHSGDPGGDAHRLEAIARHGTPRRALYDPQLQQVLREVEARRGPMRVQAFPHLGMSRARIIAPITTSNQVLGYIWIIEERHATEDLSLLAVEQAALVMALALTKERELAEVESKVRGEFLDSLLQGNFGDVQSAERRARHLGYPLGGLHILMLVDIDDFGGFLRRGPLPEDSIQAIKREFQRRVVAPVRAAHPTALVTAHSDAVLALLPVADPTLLEAQAAALGQQVKQAVADWKPGFTVTVAFSGPAEAPIGLSAAHREVSAVMEALARFGRWDQVVFAPQLGLTGLLATLNASRLGEFVERHLGPLIAHERTKPGHLVETLNTYLEAGEQQEAARRLGVHPNTLRYRLDRIAEICKADLSEPETRLNLAIALRIQNLVQLQPQQVAGEPGHTKPGGSKRHEDEMR